MISKDKVRDLVNERIEELNNGLFIVSIHVNNHHVIHVELDKHDGGVTVDDCIQVSRNVEHNLDREQHDFELNVSSAGIDKGLRVFPQYTKNIGRRVKVKLRDGRNLEGEMMDANTEGIVIQTVRKERIEGRKKKETIVEDHTVKMKDIQETKVLVSFK